MTTITYTLPCPCCTPSLDCCSQFLTQDGGQYPFDFITFTYGCPTGEPCAVCDCMMVPGVLTQVGATPVWAYSNSCSYVDVFGNSQNCTRSITATQQLTGLYRGCWVIEITGSMTGIPLCEGSFDITTVPTPSENDPPLPTKCNGTGATGADIIPVDTYAGSLPWGNWTAFDCAPDHCGCDCGCGLVLEVLPGPYFPMAPHLRLPRPGDTLFATDSTGNVVRLGLVGRDWKGDGRTLSYSDGVFWLDGVALTTISLDPIELTGDGFTISE